MIPPPRGGGVVWGRASPGRPTDIRKLFLRQEMKLIYQRGRKFEADFRDTNFFLASAPPPPAGGRGGAFSCSNSLGGTFGCAHLFRLWGRTCGHCLSTDGAETRCWAVRAGPLPLGSEMPLRPPSRALCHCRGEGGVGARGMGCGLSRTRTPTKRNTPLHSADALHNRTQSCSTMSEPSVTQFPPKQRPDPRGRGGHSRHQMPTIRPSLSIHRRLESTVVHTQTTTRHTTHILTVIRRRTTPTPSPSPSPSPPQPIPPHAPPHRTTPHHTTPHHTTPHHTTPHHTTPHHTLSTPQLYSRAGCRVRSPRRQGPGTAIRRCTNSVGCAHVPVPSTIPRDPAAPSTGRLGPGNGQRPSVEDG